MINKEVVMKNLLLVLLFMVSVNTYSSGTYKIGKISNITSVAAGLLIMLDTGKPSSCPQKTEWMLISKEDATMISVALSMHMAGKNNATIYVDANPSYYYCKIVQYDPHP